MKDLLTDEQVEQEIKRLWSTDAVKLAKKEQSIKLRRRNELYTLRWMEKRGQQLIEQGINFSNIEEKLFGADSKE